jgi:hypothetical protein
MEKEGSIPYAQELSTCSSPEPDQTNIYELIIVLIYRTE